MVCFHRRGKGDRFLTFAQWVTLHGHEQLAAGVYAPQVAMWRRYFGGRLLLLGFDELTTRDPEGTLQRVAAHAHVAAAAAAARRVAEHAPRRQALRHLVRGCGSLGHQIAGCPDVQRCMPAARCGVP